MNMKKTIAVALITGAACLASITMPAANEGCKITKHSLDGVAEITIENAFVKLTFVPSRGGVCTSFFDKGAGLEWTTPKAGGGLFEDHLWQQSYPKSDWLNSAYVLKVLSETPDKVSIELFGQGKTGDYQFMGFRKTVTLTRESAAVRLHYAFEVSNDAMSPKTVGLWFHGSLSVPGKKINYFYPVESGIKKLAYDPAIPPDEYWEYNPMRGWMAAVTQEGAGLATRMEYRRTMCFYQWFGQNLSTLEWMFRNEPVKNGSSLGTDITMLPFQGIKNVDGVGDGGVASLDIPPLGQVGASVKLDGKVVLATAPVRGKAVWAWRKLPDLIWKEFGAQNVAGVPGKEANVSASFTPDSAGLFVIRLQVSDGKAILVEAEKPYVAGKSEHKYMLTAEGERIGDPNDRFGKLAYKSGDVEIPWTDKVVTPHTAWGKPYAKGKIKALILMHCENAREVTELAQRLDMEFDAPLIDFGTPTYVGDAYGKMNPGILNDTLKKYLKKDGYDVILISGLNWKQLDKEMPELFKAQLKKGVGLVYVAPGNFPESDAWSCLPLDLKAAIKNYGTVKWRVEKNNPVTQGVPVEVLPATGIQGFKPIGGEIFMSAGDAKNQVPLAFLREESGQRTVVFNYRSSRSHGYGDCLTPFIRFPTERFAYWEYEFSMLMKAMLWAGHRESGVTLEQKVEPATPVFAKGAVTANISIAGKEAAALGASILECVLRDEYWNELKRQSFELDPKGGKTQVSFAAEGAMPIGTYFVDSILRCQGKSVAWGSVTFQVTGPSNIAYFRLADGSKSYKTGDGVVVDAEIANATDGMLLVATMTDSLGRDLLVREFPVPAGAKSQLKMALPIDRPLATEAFIRAVLKNKEQLIDRAEVDFLTFPDNYVSGVWDDYEFIPWGGMGGYNQGYLIPAKARLARDGGISVMFVNSDWSGNEDLRNEHESSIRAGFRVIEVGMWDGYPNKYEEDRANYQKTGDKKYLERKPSLSDTAYLTTMVDKVRRKALTYQRLFPFAWMWGDEQSVIGRMPVFDYDFSPYALREFRQWLAHQYGTLESLNVEWGTNYRTWDEVVPRTATEAKEAGNFAPWADHRTFMEESYTDFFATLVRTVREVSPNCLTGLSGTQAPTAYNGCDWSRFMQIFTYMQPYYYQGQENVMPSFNPSMPKANWSTGYGGTDASQVATWQCFLSGSIGTSFFALRSFFNPDFTYTKSAESATAATAPMRNGLGKLWSGVSPDFDPIAILYSQRSIQGAYLLNREWWHSHQAWFNAFHDLGFSPKFVSYTQLDSGEITPGRYKLLVLPMTSSVSTTQAIQIQEFVKAGGVVVADIHGGILDGHCRLAKPGMLDSLFGISHEGFNKPGPSGEVKFAKLADTGLNLSQLTANTALPEGNITLNGGQALGTVEKVPFAVINKLGKGKACYLNLEMSKYSGLRKEPGGDFYRGIVAGLADWAQLKRPVDLQPANLHLQLYRQREGANLYVGYVRPTDKGASWTINFTRKAHVYDALAGKYLGEVDNVKSEPASRVADLFAVLAYQVTGLQVLPSKTQANPGDRVTVTLAIQTDKGTPARHAVRASVVRPDGKVADCYSCNVALPGGKGAFDIPFALNDPEGKWTVHVRDAATGVKSTAFISLKKK